MAVQVRPAFFRGSLRACAAVAVIGVGLPIFGATLVRADLLDFFGFRPAPAPAYSYHGYAQPRARYRVAPEAFAEPEQRVRRSSRHSKARSVRRKSRVAVASASRRDRARSGETMCVRTCDGYAFPVGQLTRGERDIPAHEAACRAACPGTETALYRLPRGGSLQDPSTARAVKDGTLYGFLKTALLYRTSRVASCSCQGPDNVASRIPILSDPTLKKGDVFVDTRGDARVFAGKEQVPHEPDAFADYRGSRALGRTARAQVDKLIGTSQREATAEAFARTMKARQAEAGARVKQAEAGARVVTALREVAAPAGSARNVRVYQAQADAGDVTASGARIIVVR